jgi:GNAT superfamily N-acetyltransferase
VSVRARRAVLQPALASDHPRLREIAAASKGYWGYDQERVRAWADGLDLTRDIWIVWDGDAALGWVALVRLPSGGCELDDLWVDPVAIGEGVGTVLFRFACDRAREWGAPVLRWETDPNAVGFYERMGAVTVGEATSSWGRTIPVMQVEL